jgi:hypothetical protein
MSYIPGAGMKKPLNMLEAPIYPDIKRAPTQFKSAGKFWEVDVGKTLLDTESNTQLLGDAILARSYTDNIDSYGKSSHQEKITVFRPPLQNTYEDFGPLNRLPTKINAITVRNNPGTTNDSGGTSAFRVNNQAVPDMVKYMDDKLSSVNWMPTYYYPLDIPKDNILPDLVTSIPSMSGSAGFSSSLRLDGPTKSGAKIDTRSVVERSSNSASAGYTSIYGTNLQDQYSYDNRDISNRELHGALHAGFTPVNGYTDSIHPQLSDIELSQKLPQTSVHSGNNMSTSVFLRPEFQDVYLDRKSMAMSVGSGFTPVHMHDTISDSQNHMTNVHLTEHFTPVLSVINPSSESGYQTRNNQYRGENNLKKRENPNISASAYVDTGYRAENHNVKLNFHGKTQPVKTYGLNLDGGTIKRAGITQQNVGSRFLRGPRANILVK